MSNIHQISLRTLPKFAGERFSDPAGAQRLTNCLGDGFVVDSSTDANGNPDGNVFVRRANNPAPASIPLTREELVECLRVNEKDLARKRRPAAAQSSKAPETDASQMELTQKQESLQRDLESYLTGRSLAILVQEQDPNSKEQTLNVLKAMRNTVALGLITNQPQTPAYYILGEIANVEKQFGIALQAVTEYLDKDTALRASAGVCRENDKIAAQLLELYEDSEQLKSEKRICDKAYAAYNTAVQRVKALVSFTKACSKESNQALSDFLNKKRFHDDAWNRAQQRNFTIQAVSTLKADGTRQIQSILRTANKEILQAKAVKSLARSVKLRDVDPAAIDKAHQELSSNAADYYARVRSEIVSELCRHLMIMHRAFSFRDLMIEPIADSKGANSGSTIAPIMEESVSEAIERGVDIEINREFTDSFELKPELNTLALDTYFLLVGIIKALSGKESLPPEFIKMAQAFSHELRDSIGTAKPNSPI